MWKSTNSLYIFLNVQHQKDKKSFTVYHIYTNAVTPLTIVGFESNKFEQDSNRFSFRLVVYRKTLVCVQLALQFKSS